MPLYAIYVSVYLDKQTEQYEKILTINKTPTGPLKSLVRTITNPPLSEFKTNNRSTTSRCLYAITDETTKDILKYDEVDTLVNYLTDNGYTISYKLTKILEKHNTNENGKLIFYIEY